MIQVDIGSRVSAVEWLSDSIDLIALGSKKLHGHKKFPIPEHLENPPFS